MPLTRQEDVFGFEIAVDDPFVVRHGDGGKHRQHEVDRFGEGKSSDAPEQRREILSLQELHDQIGDALFGPHVGDVDDVGMADARGGFPLAKEPCSRPGRRRDRRVQGLDGDAFLEIPVRPLVDRAHPATSHQARDLVTAELGPGGEGVLRLQFVFSFHGVTG